MIYETLKIPLTRISEAVGIVSVILTQNQIILPQNFTIWEHGLFDFNAENLPYMRRNRVSKVHCYSVP